VNALHKESEHLVYVLGSRLVAFAKANPDLELGAINCLHTAIDAIESQCSIAREALQELDVPASLAA
jgi:hypothetical protein